MNKEWDADSLDVLGITFDNQGQSDCQYISRLHSCTCRRAYCSLGNVGMCNAAVAANVKSC